MTIVRRQEYPRPPRLQKVQQSYTTRDIYRYPRPEKFRNIKDVQTWADSLYKKLVEGATGAPGQPGVPGPPGPQGPPGAPGTVPDIDIKKFMEDFQKWAEDLYKALSDEAIARIRDFAYEIGLTTLNGLLDTDLDDPGADKIVFWDDSASLYKFLTPNTGLTITGTNLDATALNTLSGLTDTDLDDPDADKIVFWDDSASLFKFLTPNTGLTITGTNLDTIDWTNASSDFKTTGGLQSRGPFVDVRTYADLETAISTIGATETTLLIPTQQTVADDATVPTTMTLRFTRGGSVSVANTKTLTINGAIEAGPWHIFEGDGDVVFSPTSLTGTVSPHWYGAVGDYSTDDSAAIQAAIDAAISADGLVVQLEALAYRIDTGLVIDESQHTDQPTHPRWTGQSRTALVGKGNQSTFLYYTGSGTALSVEGRHTILDNFCIKGTSSANVGLYVTDCYYSTFSNIMIYNFDKADAKNVYLYAPSGDGVYYNRFYNVHISSDGSYGFYIDGVDDKRVNANTFINISCMGIGTDAADFLKYGIYSNYATANTFINVDMEQCDDGFYFNNCTSQVIIGGFGESITNKYLTTGADGDGIWMIGASPSSEQLEINTSSTGHFFSYAETATQHNTGIGLTGTTNIWGSGANHVFALGAGTAPGSSPADRVQLWCEDVAGAAGEAGLHMRTESSGSLIVPGVVRKTTTGSPSYAWEGLMCINTVDNTIDMYSDGAWRALASW